MARTNRRQLAAAPGDERRRDLYRSTNARRHCEIMNNLQQRLPTFLRRSMLCLGTARPRCASFSHPDCNCRSRNCTRSTASPLYRLAGKSDDGSRTNGSRSRSFSRKRPARGRSPPVGNFAPPRRFCAIKFSNLGVLNS